jgi:hypothetical protein
MNWCLHLKRSLVSQTLDKNDQQAHDAVFRSAIRLSYRELRAGNHLNLPSNYARFTAAFPTGMH